MEINDKTHTTIIGNLGVNSPKYIILHSTKEFSVFESLFDLHRNKNKWNGVAYHLFASNGNLYKCRPFDKEGAHAIGFNFDSIGIGIYAEKNIPKEEDLNLVKEAINEIRLEYGNLPVISHTLAQVKYINKSTEILGFSTKILENQKVILNKEFQDTKNKVDKLVNMLSTDQNLDLKLKFKDFKNCPGEEFYNFIKEVNN